MKVDKIIEVFKKSVNDYHIDDNVDSVLLNPYTKGSYEELLYKKNWVDSVQWHLEDIIRNPDIEPNNALLLKRRIDESNQLRTDLVEYIDDYYLIQYKDVISESTAKINTESPAWALDRLSILELKIYHMNIEANRTDSTLEHIEKCKSKLKILLEQESDLTLAIEQLLSEFALGNKYMKVYRQMKMYNDPSLNPILYGAKQ